MEKTGLSLDDIDTVEINEAFASVVGAWLKETSADPERVNVNGGAIALGHPLGATGARLMATLLYELERTGGRYGLQTMCEGGGQANVTIIDAWGNSPSASAGVLVVNATRRDGPRTTRGVRTIGNAAAARRWPPGLGRSTLDQLGDGRQVVDDADDLAARHHAGVGPAVDHVRPSASSACSRP